MIIYKKNDRIKIKIGGITFHLSPLTWAEKQDILAETKLQEGKPESRNSTYKCIKYAIKNIEGLFLEDGSPYAVQLENGVLSDECVEDILNLEMSPKIIMSCYSFVQGVPARIVNPVTGELVEGVEIVQKDKKKLD